MIFNMPEQFQFTTIQQGLLVQTALYISVSLELNIYINK